MFTHQFFLSGDFPACRLVRIGSENLWIWIVFHLLVSVVLQEHFGSYTLCPCLMVGFYIFVIDVFSFFKMCAHVPIWACPSLRSPSSIFKLQSQWFSELRNFRDTKPYSTLHVVCTAFVDGNCWAPVGEKKYRASLCFLGQKSEQTNSKFWAFFFSFFRKNFVFRSGDIWRFRIFVFSSFFYFVGVVAALWHRW